MEACIVICRTNKPQDRQKKVLFINAKHEVTRKNAQSYLEDEHIEKIASVYHNYYEIDGFSSIVDIDTIQDHNSSLGISLYVQGTSDEADTEDSMTAYLENWYVSSSAMHDEYNDLLLLMKDGDYHA